MEFNILHSRLCNLASINVYIQIDTEMQYNTPITCKSSQAAIWSRLGLHKLKTTYRAYYAY